MFKSLKIIFMLGPRLWHNLLVHRLQISDGREKFCYDFNLVSIIVYSRGSAICLRFTSRLVTMLSRECQILSSSGFFSSVNQQWLLIRVLLDKPISLQYHWTQQVFC